MQAKELLGWTPVRVYWPEAQPMVDWCYFGDLRFTAPFFEQTIQAGLRNPFNLLFRQQTPLEVLGEVAALQPGIQPTGFVFHMSRCGSTLVAQMLASITSNIVLAEAPPIDALLRATQHEPQASEEQRITWLRWLINVMGQQRHSDERHLFIKFDSWHTLDLPLIQRAYPSVPWIFVYRDPVEVLVSHHRMRGSQMLPGMLDPALFGLDNTAVLGLSRDAYCARVLGRICTAAVEAHDLGNGRLINYRQLPHAVSEEILPAWGITYTPAELEQLRNASQFNAKTPNLPFEPDGVVKQANATPFIRELAAQWITPAYEQLEALRQVQARLV